MVKFIKLSLIVLMTLALSSVLVYGVRYQSREILFNKTNQQSTFFGNNLYESNRYMQKETITPHIFDSTIEEHYLKIGESENIELYYHESEYKFIVHNTMTNYLWYSFSPKTETEDLNSTMRSLLTAPFYIEYFPYNNQTKKTSTTTKREVLSNVSIQSRSITNGIVLEIDYMRLNIQFDLEIYLDEGTLVARIPNETIVEDKNLVYSIQILPNFGSTLNDETPGYMLIPDGPGALYRFKDSGGKSVVTYTSRYYGVDNGIKLDSESNPLNQMSLPVFGMTHGINQHAFLGIVEHGDAHANFVMSPSGANGVNYNLTGTQFIMRESYVFPTNLKGDGIPTIIESIYKSDIQLRYLFTSEQDSNYIGMANSYQNYLVKKEILTKQTDSQTSIRLEVLLSDSELGLFGMKKVIMTTFDQTKSIVDTLLNAGVDLAVIFKGWNKDGMSGQMPYDMTYERRLGGSKGYYNLSDYLEREGVSSYLYGDYTKTYDHSKRVNERDDFARGIYRRIISRDIETIVYNNEYYLYPTTAKKLLVKDEGFYTKSGSKLALDSSGLLYSYYKNQTYYDRNIALEAYVSGLKNYGKIGLYQPNAYLFNQMEKYFDVPIFNSQYTFYDDTIPFLQTVLRGYIDMYAPLQNYFANEVEQTLMLIDFGVYPSYIVSNKETHYLKYTQANKYYSTHFKTWESKIVDTYQTVSSALDLVVGKTVIKKEVLETGIVKNTYSNGVYFIINYSDSPYTYDQKTIESKDYYVGGQS